MPLSCLSNISVRSVSLANIRNGSPLFAFAPSAKYSRFKLANSKFSKISDNPIFSICAPRFIEIKQTKFTDILSNAIRLDSDEISGINLTSKPEINSSYLQVSNCQFIRCKAQIYTFDGMEGGALLLRGIISDISDCIFRQCQAYQNGGAIRVSSSARVSLNTSIFSENSANKWCGGTSFYFVFVMNISDCNFTDNKCNEKVACLMACKCLEAKTSNIIMVNNTALSHGCTWIEKSTFDAVSHAYVGNIADFATSLVATQGSIVLLKESFFSDLYRNPSILCSSKASIKAVNCKFGGSISDEFTKEDDGEVTQEECVEGEKIVIEMTQLPSIQIEQETEEVKENYQIPNLNLGAPEQQRQMNRHTFEQDEGHGLDKSTIMIIAYAVVIMFLIVGLRMYFTGGEVQVDQKNTSIFGDDDYDNNAGEFLHTAAAAAGVPEHTPEAKEEAEKPELEKLVPADVPLENQP